ncbi:hypothetical protein FB451DRAFT_1192725 [Mycena latifolia]|nr:hypothetical protein FB451DRAFT_1192725 [Mycena latifolia]
MEDKIPARLESISRAIGYKLMRSSTSSFSQHLGHVSGLCWIANLQHSPSILHNKILSLPVSFNSYGSVKILENHQVLQVGFFGKYGFNRDPIKVFFIVRILLRSSLLGVLDCFRGINTSDSALGAPQTLEHKLISRGTGLYLPPVSPGRSEAIGYKLMRSSTSSFSQHLGHVSGLCWIANLQQRRTTAKTRTPSAAWDEQ